MARPGRKATWVPPITADLIDKSPYEGVYEACAANGLPFSSIKRLYTETPPAVQNVVEWLMVLGFTDADPAMKVLMEATRHNTAVGGSIVPSGEPKHPNTSRTVNSSDIERPHKNLYVVADTLVA